MLVTNKTKDKSMDNETLKHNTTTYTSQWQQPARTQNKRPKPMATTNVSSCVGSSSHTSGAVDDPDDDEGLDDDISESHFVWYMLCYVFF